MRNQKLLLGIGILAANAMVMSTAQADRRTGLSGNLLIQDPDDIFPFPQLVLQHRNMIRLDYGGPAGAPAAAPGSAAPAIGANGNGVLTLGTEDMAFALSLHRGDIMSPDVVGQGQELQWLSGVQNPFGSTAITEFGAPALPAYPDRPAVAAGTPGPATVLDLAFAMPMGDNALGARFAFGRSVQAATVDGDTQKGASNFIAVQVGYSMLPEDGLKLDLAGNVVAGLGKSTDAGGDTVNKGNNIRAGFLARGYLPFNDVVDLGLLGNVSFDNEHTKTEATSPNASSNDFQFNLLAAAGPSINLERAKVAAYGGLIVGAGKNEPNSEVDDNEVNRVQFAAPVVNMATEVQLLDWMYVRTGAQYVWGLDRRGGYKVAGDDAHDKVTSGVFGWTAGLGVTKSNFFLDGVISNGFITNGPAFIGGGAPGFLAMASLTYKFGDVFNDGAIGGGSEPAEAPEPAPAPAPAPTQESAAPAADGSASGAANAGGGTLNVGGQVGGSVGTP